MEDEKAATATPVTEATRPVARSAPSAIRRRLAPLSTALSTRRRPPDSPELRESEQDGGDDDEPQAAEGAADPVGGVAELRQPVRDAPDRPACLDPPLLDAGVRVATGDEATVSPVARIFVTRCVMIRPGFSGSRKVTTSPTRASSGAILLDHDHVAGRDGRLHASGDDRERLVSERQREDERKADGRAEADQAAEGARDRPRRHLEEPRARRGGRARRSRVPRLPGESGRPAQVLGGIRVLDRDDEAVPGLLAVRPARVGVDQSPPRTSSGTSRACRCR